MTFINNAKLIAKFFLTFCLASFVAFAQANNCETMADMAKDVATLRDAGVPLIAVEKRLRKDVSDPEELAFALIVTRLVYKTNGTSQQLKMEVLKRCK
jgi:hypothetical protein